MNHFTRREAARLLTSSATALSLAPKAVLGADEPAAALTINPAPRFELSPYLYMQFLEPLGTTDGSVEAAWNHKRDRWREDVVASREEHTVFLQVANTQDNRPVRVKLQVDGRAITGGRVFEIADDPMVEVSQLNSAEVMKTVEKPLSRDAIREFPAASVSAVELEFVLDVATT